MSTAEAGRAIVLDIVGLRPSDVDSKTTPNLASVLSRTAHLRPPFPAVTVPVQTTLGEGRGPAAHGDVMNGEYDRESGTVEFWGRERGDRTRIWEAASEAGLTTGALFFQHLKGTTADVAVTPSPIEDENNEMIEMDCWTNPDEFYDQLREEYGHFPLHNYWGPAASAEASRWILAAAREAVERFDPDLLWVYVPHLDYDGLAHGPGEELDAELPVVDELVGEFVDALRDDDRWSETVVNVVSEYGFHAVDSPVFPNRALREAGLLSVVEVEGGADVDIPSSAAFAAVDHQVAHVYADDPAAAREVLAGLDGIDAILADDDAKADYGVDHPNAGDLVLVADRDAWFQYYWWDADADESEQPPYATDVDIHDKPGFDPCEVHLGETGLVTLDAARVGGSHGRVDPQTRGIYAVGGPAAPDRLPEEVDARAVAPTLADLLGVDLDMPFERPSLFESADR